jgi:hypothetical protein
MLYDQDTLYSVTHVIVEIDITEGFLEDDNSWLRLNVQHLTDRRMKLKETELKKTVPKPLFLSEVVSCSKCRLATQLVFVSSIVKPTSGTFHVSDI